MKRKIKNKLLKTSVITTALAGLVFGLGLSPLLPIYQVLIIAGSYFLWELFFERMVMGGD